MIWRTPEEEAETEVEAEAEAEAEAATATAEARAGTAGGGGGQQSGRQWYIYGGMGGNRRNDSNRSPRHCA